MTSGGGGASRSESAPREVLIRRQEWTVKTDNGTAARLQVPLKLGYALTVHKSQGLSMSLLEVDLQKCFDYGQAYVALSRATHLSGAEPVSHSTSSHSVEVFLCTVHSSPGRLHPRCVERGSRTYRHCCVCVV